MEKREESKEQKQCEELKEGSDRRTINKDGNVIATRKFEEFLKQARQIDKNYSFDIATGKDEIDPFGLDCFLSQIKPKKSEKKEETHLQFRREGKRCIADLHDSESKPN